MHRADVVAGLSVAGIMLPEAIAYAGIAGLSPQRALAAAVAGGIGYAVVGRSRFAIVAPTSSSAAILAAALATLPGDMGQRAAMATVIVGLTGLVFMLASMMRLGALASFISRPVLRGFAFGLALTIIIRQLPLIVGLSLHAPNIFRLTTALAKTLPHWNPVSVAIGGAALAMLLGLRRWQGIPAAFLTLAAGITLSMLVDLSARGVSLVGPLDLALQSPVVPNLSWPLWSRLAQLALPLVLILFAESWGTMRALALRHGDNVDPDRELGALASANFVAALVQGMPVGAGFSASSASEAARAASRITGVIAAVGLALLVIAGRDLVARLPEPVLAAVVIAALTHALSLQPLLRLFRLDRDQYVALFAAPGVILLGVLNGMLIAIALSLAALLRRLAALRLTLLGQLGDSHDYVDLSRHPDATQIPDVLIWRPATPLFFANADRVLAMVADRSIGRAGIRTIVLSLEESGDLDSSAIEALIEFDQRIAAAGLKLQLARVHDHVRELLAVAGASGLLERSSYSVDDAVSTVRAQIDGRQEGATDEKPS